MRREACAVPVARDLVVVAGMTLLFLLPFIGKAFHVDDPLFLWAGRAIQLHPFQPGNPWVNWYGTAMPMSEVMRNPPLASYYIAGAASVLGWSERALHLAFLLPALAATTGTYLLARQFTALPLLAALLAMISPVFVVSATTVMCDVPMLALTLWGTLLWCNGCRSEGRVSRLFGVSLLSAAVLTKYLAAPIIPLLLLWTWHDVKRVQWRMGLLLLPLFALLLYLWAASGASGTDSFLSSLRNATSAAGPGTAFRPTRMLVALTFLGGGFIGVLFYLPFLMRLGAWLSVSGAAAAAVGLAAASSLGMSLSLQRIPLADPLNAAHFVVFALAGIVIVVLVGGELLVGPPLSVILLSVWTIAALGFVMFVSWSVSGRYLLPVMPAVGILVARSIDRRGPVQSGYHLYLPLIPTALLVSVVAWSDYALADSARVAAENVARLARPARNTLWFEGHWGFQYYLEREGGRALDVRFSKLSIGDRVVIPSNNTNKFSLRSDCVAGREVIEADASPVASTMNPAVGAGFYTHLLGPFPFYLGKVAREKYYVLAIRRSCPVERCLGPTAAPH